MNPGILRRGVLRSLWLVILLGLCSAGSACAEKTGPTVPWQYVAVTLVPENHLLIGESTILYSPGSRRVSLALNEHAQVDYVEVGGKRGPFSFAGGAISVELPASAEAVPVTVSYRATFNDPVSRHPAAAEDPSYGVNGAITREGTFLGDGARWYPIPAQVPLRRSVSIAAPTGMEGLSYGRRVSRETVGDVTRSLWEEARPVGALSLVAGHYRIEERRVKGVDLYSYLYPGNASLSGRYLDAAAKYLTLYSDLFGPYPFEKFAVVENFFPTGYGFPSFTLLGGSVIRLPFIVDTSFPHEIAHSWWGNGIGVDPREGNWCEGLVTYLADYYLKELHSPAEARDYRRQLLIDYASLVTPAADFPLASFESRSDPPSRAIGYGKGAMLFHMVRRRIGDGPFFEALRQVSRDHMYGAASWSDFIRAFSRTAGSDQATFMRQFLTRSGGPRLSLAEVASKRQGERSTVTGSVVQASPLFELEVPLRLETASAKLEQAVTLRGERTPFSILTAAAPARLLLDPDAEIFRILSQGEIPATVNSLKGSSRLLGVITEKCRAKEETFRDLLASLSQGAAPVVRETELDRSQASRHDLVFCGMPGDRSLLPPFPREIEVAENVFSVEGTTFTAPDALLLAVLRKDAAGPVAALFLPLSEAGAAQYAQKITHYGKYGYLVFAGGANRLKGTAAATDKEVAVQLR